MFWNGNSKIYFKLGANIMKYNIKFVISKIIRICFSPPTIRGSKIDKTVSIWDYCTVAESRVDRFTYISDHTMITHCDIGAFCSIGSYCNIGCAAHPISYVSTSPIFLTGKNPLNKNFSRIEFNPYEKTIIGNDVWIGTHVLIKSGVKIQDGAVIGSGAVVTKDIGAYEIWGGGYQLN